MEEVKGEGEESMGLGLVVVPLPGKAVESAHIGAFSKRWMAGVERRLENGHEIG